MILSDISMPEMDGFEFIRCVRALEDPRIRATPAIAVTAYARHEDCSARSPPGSSAM